MEISEDGPNLIWLKLKDRHGGVSGDQPLTQAFSQVLGLVAFHDIAKRWSRLKGAKTRFANCMAPAAIGLEDRSSLFNEAFCTRTVHTEKQ